MHLYNNKYVSESYRLRKQARRVAGNGVGYINNQKVI